MNCSFASKLKKFVHKYQKLLQDFGSEGTSDKISYMNSTKVLYCNGVAKISVQGDIQQKFTHLRVLKNFEKFIKILHKNLKLLQNFSKLKF